ncbi:DUF4262 domain-containing protein [Glutamicibacter halophytocola]|uniref:DUF4262 domain-containing protein n=1 Tax=Glutamicibacter halophytocola TaxID=1933880 RepID=UPI003D28DDC9
MCDICDGMSIEEADARTDQCIRDYGRQVLFVEPGRYDQPFAYTIGLSLVGHPEFLVRGVRQPGKRANAERALRSSAGAQRSVRPWAYMPLG